MKEVWQKATEQVCGWTKGPPRHSETWWWNDEVAKAIEEKEDAVRYGIKPEMLSRPGSPRPRPDQDQTGRDQDQDQDQTGRDRDRDQD